MRMTLCMVALAGLTACTEGDQPISQPKTKAAVASFDGSDYRDQADKLSHGKRLATVLECISCHGEGLQGRNVTADEPDYGDMNAPNLTLKMAEYRDSDFEKFLRTGIPKDGRKLYFMAPEAYQFLSDSDLQAILAFVRSFPPAGKQLPPIRKGAGFERELLEGGFSDAAAQVIRYRDHPPVDVGRQHERGRRLVQIVCSGCHNGELQGYEGFTPDLDIAGAYSPAELEELLTTGKGKSKPDLGLMTSVAKSNLSKLTPDERKAIVGYVLARANRPQPAN